MDANGDGVVTKEELKNLLKGLGEDVTDDIVDEMIKIADENGDGKIQFEEFVSAATDGNIWADLHQSPRCAASLHAIDEGRTGAPFAYDACHTSDQPWNQLQGNQIFLHTYHIMRRTCLIIF